MSLNDPSPRPPLPRGELCVAALVSLAFALELQFAASLGFYLDDFSKAAGVLQGGYEGLGVLGRFWASLLTDEPLFNLYHDLRFWVLGFDSALPHHLLQGAAQAANGVLLWALVWRLSADRFVSWSATLIFLAYPGLGQATFWTSAIYVPLLTVFLLALHCWLKWLAGGARGWLAATSLLYASAVFAHEAAFGFWAVFAALWAWERSQHRSAAPWSGPLLLALINCAYLAVRQTDWFGLGFGGMAAQRALSGSSAPELAFASVNLNFGPWFVSRILEFEAAAGPSDLARAVLFGVIAAGALGFGLRRGESPLWVARLAGMAAVLGCIWLVTAWAVQPNAARILIALVYTAGAGALAFGFVRAQRRELAVVAAFGGLWFLAGFAPTYVYYLAFRHSYLPAVGAALVWAALLAAPRRLAVGVTGRAVVEGASAAALAYLVGWFHFAQLGEVRQWVDYADEIRGIEQAVKQIEPRPSPGERIVLLGVREIRHTNPVFEWYVVDDALRLWLDEPQLEASSYFQAEADGFRMQPDGPLEDYPALRSFRLEGGRLRELDVSEVLAGPE